jgi:hypothetical protein
MNLDKTAASQLNNRSSAILLKNTVIVHRRRSLALHLPASLRKREQEEKTHRGLTTHSGPSRENNLHKRQIRLQMLTDSKQLFLMPYRIRPKRKKLILVDIAASKQSLERREISDL